MKALLKMRGKTKPGLILSPILIPILSLIFTTVFYGKNALASLVNVAPPQPVVSSSSWSYNFPAKGASATPTIDRNGAYYLPYLPWLGQNLTMLVNYSDFFYKLQQHIVDGTTAPFNVQDTTTAATLLTQTEAANITAASSKTAQNLSQQLLTYTPNSANLNALLLVPGTDIGTPCFSSVCPQNPPAPTNAAFNADTLFGTTGYTIDQNGQNNDINHLIVFLSNLTSLAANFQNPGFSPDQKTMAAQLNSPAVKNYVLSVRSAAAMQSMVLSNFNYLAQERQIISGLGTKANMVQSSSVPGSPATPVSDASQLQLDKYLIDRRLNNPAWYSNMSNASPEAVQRETLFVLAEMQRQLFEMRLLNERILATLSLTQIGTAQMNNQMLLYQFNMAQAALQPPPASAP